VFVTYSSIRSLRFNTIGQMIIIGRDSIVRFSLDRQMVRSQLHRRKVSALQNLGARENQAGTAAALIESDEANQHECRQDEPAGRQSLRWNSEREH